MPRFLIPSCEPQRLEAMRRYRVLNLEGEKLFNAMAAIVARIFKAPVALLTLVHADEVQFVGNAGLEGTASVPRSDSLCSVAILQDGITHFEDLQERPSFLTNPGVVAKLNLRFYAGASLRTATGFFVGALCIMDHLPRRFSMVERTLLDSLSEVAMSLLDLQAARVDSLRMTALRNTLHGRITRSLDHIGTLADLGNGPARDGDEALAFRQTGLEEATHLTQKMQQELQEALFSLAE